MRWRPSDAAGCAYFLSVLLTPFIWMPLKVLAGVVWLCARFLEGRGTVNASRALAAFVIFAYALFQLLYIVYGQLMGAPHESLLFTLPVYVAFPAFVGVACFVVEARDISFVLKTSAALLPCISIYLMAYFLGEIGVLPVKVYTLYDKSLATYVDGDAGIGHPLVSVLLWCMPCFVLVQLGGKGKAVLRWLVAMVVLGLAAAVSVLSSRRSIVLTTIVAVAAYIALGFGFEARGMVRRAIIRVTSMIIVSGAALAVTATALDVDVGSYMVSLASPAQHGTQLNQSDVIRKQQIAALIRGVRQHQVFGNGVGSYTKVVVRNETKPWRYEMGFYAAIFRYGVVGSVLYLLLIAAIVGCGLQLLAEQGSRPEGFVPYILIAATLGQLGGYLVNPILDSLDTAWELFIPALILAALSQEFTFKRLALGVATHG